MRVEQVRHQMWYAALGMFVLSLLVAVADRMGCLSSVRPVLHDAFSPGRLVLMAIRQRTADSSNTTAAVRSAVTEPANQLNAERLQLLRQLMIENARLRQELKRSRAADSMAEIAEPAEPLSVHALISANVISSSGMPDALQDLIISAGRSAGITRSELVVDGSGAVIDAGTDAGVAEGDRVLSGLSVIGRIEQAGRWVSLVQPVTAADFRAQVQLLRASEDGLHFGAIGMLEGTGSTDCRLTGIVHTDAVTVGDSVVTANINGVRGPRLFFGTVTAAEFLAGGQWDVRIQPGCTVSELDQVGIVHNSLQLDARELASAAR